MSFLLQKAKGHSNFAIELNHPPGHVFTENEIVSGTCILFSSHDENVGDVSVIFQGLVKSHVFVPNPQPQVNSNTGAKYNSEFVLFTRDALLYQGGSTLKKNVRYTWPFEFQFPTSQLPSGGWDTGRLGNAQVEYTLKASRGRTWKGADQLGTKLDARNDLKGAPFQPRGIFEKLAGFAGAVSIVGLSFHPRPRVPPAFNLQWVGGLHDIHSGGLSGFLHLNQQPTDPSSSFSIDIGLPESFIRGQPLALVLSVRSAIPNFPETRMRAISIALVTNTVIRSSGGTHHSNDEVKRHLLEMTDQALPLPLNTPVDLGRMLGCMFQPDVAPGFGCELLEISHDLKVHVTVECGDRSFEAKHVLEKVNVF